MAEKRMLAKDEEFLLALKGEAKKRGRLTSLLRLSSSAYQRIYEKLIKYGFINKVKYGFCALTDKGKSYVETLSLTMRPTFKDLKVQTLIDKLPTEPHRALFRLLLSGVIAKKYLFNQFNDNWAGFIIGGRTKTFKTGLAKVICCVLGLDFAENIYSLHTATAGEFGVRRQRAKGKAMFDISSSPYFSYPFVCLDELDKINDRAVKRNVMHFLDGRREFTVEAKKIVNWACVLVTLNSKLSELDLPEEYIRRCVVVNTDPLVYELKDVDLVAREIFDNPIPRVRIENLRANFTHFDIREFELMRELLYQGTREDKRHLIDTKPLEILTLGRLILSASLDIQEAIFESVYDRLICLETLGLTVEDWREPLTKKWIEYKGQRDPELERKRIEIEEKRRERQELYKERQREIDKEEERKLNESFGFDMEYSRELGRLKTIISDLFELPGARWKYKTKPIRDGLVKKFEYFDRGKRNPEKLKQLKVFIPEGQKEAEPYLREYQREREQVRRKKEQGKADEEERRAILSEMGQIASELYRNWRGNEKADELRKLMRGAIKSQEKYPLGHLRNWLAEARERRESIKNEPVARDPRTDVAEDYANVFEALLGEGIKWWLTRPKKTNPPGPELKEEKKEDGRRLVFPDYLKSDAETIRREQEKEFFER